MSIFDHSFLREEYDNEEHSISKDFIVPCLKHCSRYRRATYSFTSAALEVWAGSLAHIIDKNVKIEILCDMSVLCAKDKRLKIGIEKATNEADREKFLRDYQDEILLQAIKFDGDSSDYKAKRMILDWLFANGQLELKFAYPKDKPPDEVDVKYHKKMGYFEYSENEHIAFKGSWNETKLGGGINGEECDVYSSERSGDVSRCKRTITKVDNDWNNLNKKFHNLGVSKKMLKLLKERAPRSVEEILEEFPDIYDVIAEDNEESNPLENEITESKLSPEYTEDDLYDYQTDVLDNWEKNGRQGLVKHATGSGKTFTSIFALKKHFETESIGLIIVPSSLLQEQWKIEIPKIIPETKNSMLLVGGSNSQWRKKLKLQSKPRKDKVQIIIAVINSAATEDFLSRLNQGPHLMIVADEVHTLGSGSFSKVLSIEAGAKLGVSATPERYNDPDGTKKIFDYFGGLLEPEFPIEKAIGKSLVPYEYHPQACYLSEEELDDWEEQSLEIKRLAAMCKRNSKDEIIPSHTLKLKLIERSRIAKRAISKISVTRNLLKQNYISGQRWLVYCDSISQIEDIQTALKEADLYSSIYHSEMHQTEKERNIENFEAHGGILLSIKCLDEGFDMPSITHALIIASDQNPRQFIQRRGRVLRKDKNNPEKTKAFLYDLVISNEVSGSHPIQSLSVSELRRSLEFSTHALNKHVAEMKIRDFALAAKIKISDIIEDDIFAEIEDEEDFN